MTEQKEQLISHYNASKKFHVALHHFEEGIRKGILPFTHYTIELYGNTNMRREIWWLTPEQVEEAGITLRAQRYGELQLPEETRLGVRRRVYNYSLRTARLRLGLTTAQLAEKVGINQQLILAYENLRQYPSLERAKAIADALGVPVDAIFAPWLAEFTLQRSPSVLEDAHFSLQEALAAGVQLRSLPNPEDEQIIEQLDQELLKERIAEALGTLTDREQRVLELRFGLNGEEPRTLAQVGREFGVVRERIHQIEARALAKLRHPTRVRKLQAFLD